MKKFLKIYSSDSIFLEKLIVFFIKNFNIYKIFFLQDIFIIYRYKFKLCKSVISSIFLEIKIYDIFKILFFLKSFKRIFYFIN